MNRKYNKCYKNKDKHATYSNCPCMYIACANMMNVHVQTCNPVLITH